MNKHGNGGPKRYPYPYTPMDFRKLVEGVFSNFALPHSPDAVDRFTNLFVSVQMGGYQKGLDKAMRINAGWEEADAP